MAANPNHPNLPNQVSWSELAANYEANLANLPDDDDEDGDEDECRHWEQQDVDRYRELTQHLRPQPDNNNNNNESIAAYGQRVQDYIASLSSDLPLAERVRLVNEWRDANPPPQTLELSPDVMRQYAEAAEIVHAEVAARQARNNNNNHDAL